MESTNLQNCCCLQIKTSQGGDESGSVIADDKTINEASAELRSISDDGKRRKVQEKLDELTASGYKVIPLCCFNGLFFLDLLPNGGYFDAIV